MAQWDHLSSARELHAYCPTSGMSDMEKAIQKTPASSHIFIAQFHKHFFSFLIIEQKKSTGVSQLRILLLGRRIQLPPSGIMEKAQRCALLC